MIVKLITKYPVITQFSAFDNSFYDERLMYPYPHELSHIPSDILHTAYRAISIRAGYTFVNNSVFYMSSSGNWVYGIRDSKELIAGGEHGHIPWDYLNVGHADVREWVIENDNSVIAHPLKY